ncbi:MAG: acyltransferase, partial [Armatimonadota bacterium]
GLLGVLLFFIVSGTVISASIERAPSLKVFWLQRFWRLFPAYWASLIFSAVLFLLVPAELNYGIYHGIKDRFWTSFAANTTMLQGFIGFDHFVPAYWTLGFEMMFYFALTLFALTKLGKHSHQVLWAISGLIFLASLYGYLKGAHVGSFKVTLCGYFWLGISVHRFLKNEVSPKLFWIALSVFQLSVISTLYVNFHLFPAKVQEVYSEFPFSLVAMLSAYLGATVVFIGFLLLRDRSFPKSLVVMGTISYSLYLFHSLAIRLGGMAFDQKISPFGFTIVSIGMTVILTLLSYKFIEKPSLLKVKAIKLRTSV